MIYSTGLYIENNLFEITDNKEVIMRVRDETGKIVKWTLNQQQIKNLYEFAVLAKTFTEIKEQEVSDSFW